MEKKILVSANKSDINLKAMKDSQMYFTVL